MRDFLGKYLLLIVAVAAGAASFYVAWQMQENRILTLKNDAAKKELERQAEFDRRLLAEQQTQREKGDAYRSKLDDLEGQIAKGEAFRRCVAAGKCGSVRRESAVCPASGVSPRPDADAAGTDAIPAGRESAEGAQEIAEEPAVVRDCAKTTLMLNSLQDAIEAQDGYRQ